MQSGCEYMKCEYGSRDENGAPVCGYAGDVCRFRKEDPRGKEIAELKAKLESSESIRHAEKDILVKEIEKIVRLEGDNEILRNMNRILKKSVLKISDKLSRLTIPYDKATEEIEGMKTDLRIRDEQLTEARLGWRKSEQKLTRLTDRLDLMKDEFVRILACDGVTLEVRGICERAQEDIKQNVPVIVQRDDLLEKLSRLTAPVNDDERAGKVANVYGEEVNRTYTLGRTDGITDYRAMLKEEMA